MKWDENKHPRDKDGKFTSGGGGESSSPDTPMKKPKKLYDKSKYIMLPKKEYAELCSAIRTKYADKIPKEGGMLYKNDYYVYTYSKRKEQILCRLKLDIVKYGAKIKRIEEVFNERNKR